MADKTEERQPDEQMRKLAEKLAEHMPPHMQRAETERAERILCAELESIQAEARQAESEHLGHKRDCDCLLEYPAVTYPLPCSCGAVKAKERAESAEQQLAEARAQGLPCYCCRESGCQAGCMCNAPERAAWKDQPAPAVDGASEDCAVYWGDEDDPHRCTLSQDHAGQHSCTCGVKTVEDKP